MKRIDDATPGVPRDFHGRQPHDLCAVERQLLRALRQMALVQPLGSARCRRTHAALQRDFGDAGLAVEHLLRCWMVGLERRAARPLMLGLPGCPLITGDEYSLFGVLRSAGRDPALAAQHLAGFGAAAPALLPLFAALAETLAPFVANSA